MERLVNIISFILALGLLHTLSYRMALKTLNGIHDAKPCDSWIAYGVIFTTFTVTGFHLLGAATYLAGVPLVHIMYLCGLLLGVWIINYSFLGRSWQRRIPTKYECLQAVPRVCSVLPTGVIERCCAGVALGIVCLFLLEAGTRFPTGWDGLVYHLPLAAKWFQGWHLNLISESWKFMMPSNGEVFLLFLLYSGNEHVLSIAFLPFYLLGLLVVYGFSLRVGASHDHSVMATIGFGTLPIVLYNTFGGFGDLFGCVFALSSLYFIFWILRLQEAQQHIKSRLLALSGLSFGMALGAKYTFVPPFFLFMGAIWLLGMTRNLSGKFAWREFRQACKECFLWGGWGLLGSAYWYVRNWLLSGNPMHPMMVIVNDVNLRASLRYLRERWDKLMPYAFESACLRRGQHVDLWISAPWTDCHYSGEHLSINWGLGAVFGSFIPITLIVVFVFILVKLFRDRSFPLLGFPFLVGVGLVCYWWEFLFNNLRLILHVLGLMFVFFAFFLSLFSGWRLRLIISLMLCALMVNAGMLAAQPLMEIGFRIHNQIWKRHEYYNIPEIINFLPKDSVILNASHELNNYPLFGRGLQNRVVTNRALVEPRKVTVITSDLVNRLGVNLIFLETNQRYEIDDDLPVKIVYVRDLETARGQYQQILYQIE